MTKRVWRNPRRGVFGAAAALAGLLGCAAGWAQTPPLPVNLNLVLLDAAHGGPDPGSHLNGNVAEKDVTLALAARLRTTLIAKGFTVTMTRDSDAGLTSVQRADLANHAHPLACLLLHATSSGLGVYLAASSLAPDMDQRAVLPWETAQASFIPQSLGLLDEMVRSVTAISAKPVVLRASVPPIDSLTCATVLVEMAPMGGKPVTDEGYQQKVADGLADALMAWRAQETTVNLPREDAPAGTGTPGTVTVPAPAKPRLKPLAPSGTAPDVVLPAANPTRAPQ